MEVALYKVEEWEPPADWVDRGRRVGSSRRRSRGRGSRRQRRRKSKQEKEDENDEAAVAAAAAEPEGFMNPRCGGLDRLCRISVFEEDGNGLQITVKVAPAARLD